MRRSAVFLLVMFIASSATFASTPASAQIIVVPGDLDGDMIVSGDEMASAEQSHRDGKISPEQLEEIEHIHENYPRTIVDSVDRTVTIYKPVERVITFGGYDAEIMYILGDEDKIVGTASWMKDKDFYKIFLPTLIEAPAPGTAATPDYEMILELNPDLIICWHYYPTQLVEQLPDTITVVALDFFDPRTFLEEARKFAYILDKEVEMEDYVENFYSKYMDLIKDRTEGLTEEERPRVYWERLKPYETFGSMPYITSLIELCGGRNIFADTEFDIAMTDAESVVKSNPDIIIRYASSTGPETGYGVEDPAGAKALRDSILERPELALVDAVEDENVYVMNMVLPLGVQGPVGAAYAARVIQPNLFSDIDPDAIAQELFSEYLGVESDAAIKGVLVYPPLEVTG
jgi:iron complex transport system substrate-binding protein